MASPSNKKNRNALSSDFLSSVCVYFRTSGRVRFLLRTTIFGVFWSTAFTLVRFASPIPSTYEYFKLYSDWVCTAVMSNDVMKDRG